MKKLISLILCLALCVSVCGLTACGGTTDAKKYSISVGMCQNGAISVDKQLAAEGETVTVTATPDTGYYLVGIEVNGASSDLTFTMPAKNVTVTATFAASAAPTYAVTLVQSEGGTVVADKLNAAEGEIVTVTATPDTDYVLVSTTVDGTPFDTSFTMPAHAVTVTATFAEIKSYAIELDHSKGGTLTADKTRAKAGETVTLTATPADNYELDCIELNGAKLDGTTFVMPEGKATVYATFVADGTFYAISTQNDRRGVVSVSRNEARAGSVVYCDHLPLSGYILKSYTLDGVEIGAEGRFVMPNRNAVVGAIFVKAIEDTSVTVKSNMLNSDATSHWYLTAGADGIDITVKVEDALLITTGEAHYRDYVALGITAAATATNTFTVGKTFQLVVTADGTCYMRTAVTGTAYGKEVFNFDKTLWSATAVEKKLRDKDGYSGYEVKIHISYALLELEDSAVKTVRLCPALNNSESTVSGNWECYAAPGTEWLIPTTWMTV